MTRSSRSSSNFSARPVCISLAIYSFPIIQLILISYGYFLLYFCWLLTVILMGYVYLNVPILKLYRVSQKKSTLYWNQTFCCERPLWHLWEFIIASKTNSNTKMWNYKFVLPPVRVRMVQLTTEQQIFERNRLFVWNCFAVRCVMLFGRSGSYNYSDIYSIKFPEVSQRTFKTRSLISIEGTFFWDTLYKQVVQDNEKLFQTATELYRVYKKKRNHLIF